MYACMCACLVVYVNDKHTHDARTLFLKPREKHEKRVSKKPSHQEDEEEEVEHGNGHRSATSTQ